MCESAIIWIWYYAILISPIFAREPDVYGVDQNLKLSFIKVLIS